jgi:acyl-CoA thioesterase-1
VLAGRCFKNDICCSRLRRDGRSKPTVFAHRLSHRVGAYIAIRIAKTINMQRMIYVVQFTCLLTVMVLSCVSASARDFGRSHATSLRDSIAGPGVEIQPGNWVVMGSSTAAGTGAPRNKGWVALVAKSFETHGIRVVNLAKGGSVTYKGRSSSRLIISRRPRPDLGTNIDAALTRLPTLLLISYPTNDTTVGYSVDETVNNVLEMRAQAQEAGVPVIAISTQPRNLSDTQLAQLSSIDERLGTVFGPCFVAVRQALASGDGKLAPTYDWGDGVHVNQAGHLVIAEHVIETINSERCVQITKGRTG